MAIETFWLGRCAARCLHGFFETLDHHISEQVAAQPHQDERYLTGLFLATLNNPNQFVYYRELQSCLRSCRAPHGPASVTISIVAHSQYQESSKGADMGMVLTISSPEVSVRKAILIQAKRLYADSQGRFTLDCEYTQITDKQQAKDMIAQTSSSFFLLYNPSALLLHKRRTIAGIHVVPATAIEGFNFQLPRTPTTLRGHMTSFADFMVRDFVKCKLGDSREALVKTANGENDEFPVKYTFQVSVAQGEAARRARE